MNTNITIARSEGGRSNTRLTLWNPTTTSLVKNFSTPVIGTKDGAYFIRCTGSKRNNEDTSDEANILILDGDKRIDEYGELIPGAPDPELVHKVLTSLGLSHLIYSSFSNGRTSAELEAECIYSGGLSGADYHKYRVIIPCTYSPDLLPILLDYLFSELHQAGVMLAPVNENRAWSQPWYFPRVPDEQRKAHFKFYQHDGSPLDTYATTKDWLREHPQPVRAEPPPLKPKKPINESNGRRNPLREFNQSYSLHDVLLRNGYIQKGLKYLRPDSESKIPGVQICTNCKDGVERVYSHGGDVLNDGWSHDSFDVMRLLESDGNWKKALRWSTEINMHNSREWRKQQEQQQQQKNNNSTSGNGTTGQQDETKAKKESSFSAKWLDGDALADSAEAPYFIINNILEADSHGLMIGASESFKTFCALKMAHCITTGNDFFGHSVFTPGKVLYICGEGKGALKRRIRALKQVEGGFNNNLHVLAAPLLIDDKTAMAWLSAQVKAIKPLLVISDTFSSLTTITNENDNSDVAKTLQLMKDTCSDGKTVSLVIHHLGKDATKGTRGASAFNANTDFRLEMVRSAGSMLTTLSSGKTKDSDNFDDIQMMAHVVELPLIRQDGRATTSLILKPTDEQPKATRSGLSARDDAILQTLNDAIATHGVEPGTEIKAKFAGFDSYEGKLKQVVHIDHWRELAYKTITIDDVVKDKSQALRKAFKRCRDKLFDTGYIVEHGDYVWRIFDEKRT